MTLLALLLALAQQGGQPTTHDQPGVSQPSPNDARPERSTASNTSDKAEALSPEHHTDPQGGTPAKKAKRAKKKNQARAAKPLPEPSSPPSAEQDHPEQIERKGGKGKAPKQPKPIGEKADQ
ncbi:MAG TPA: hypothetical protein VKB92_06025 [Myxococcales bacterium]|nr:hypothetical protein [Myxococcales bacterium]